MRDTEDSVVQEYDFMDVYKILENKKYYNTYDNFRYDRFFIKDCEAIRFKTLNTHTSEHLMIVTDIFLPKVLSKVKKE